MSSADQQLTPRDGLIDYLRQEFLRQHDAREDVREFLTQNQHVLLVEEDKKCNLAAEHFRERGDSRNVRSQFLYTAPLGYSRSIAFAEGGSEQLGLAYAGRAKAFFGMEEYEFALDNIELARVNGHPDEEVLRDMEVRCKQRIANGESLGTVPGVRMDIRVDRNPKLPFLAAGIRVDKEGVMVAERDFKPGDVIMNVEPLLTAIHFHRCHEYCSHCGAKFRNSFIPCPGCVLFMYCHEECLKENWNQIHRFECSVATKLRRFSHDLTLDIARMFLYGLTLFDDDLTEMKQFCEEIDGAEMNRFELDFSKLNQRELFRILHCTAPQTDPDGESTDYLEERMISFGYYLIFRSNPALAKIIEDHRDFTLQTLFNYARSASTLRSVKEDDLVHWIFPAKPALVHNCDPNAMTSFESSHLKTVLLRPVQAGQQIIISSGRPWWDSATLTPTPNCQCVSCAGGWRAMENHQLPVQTVLDYYITTTVCEDANTSEAAKLNRMKRFIERNAHVYPAKLIGGLLAVYQNLLNKAIFDERVMLDRAKVKKD